MYQSIESDIATVTVEVIDGVTHLGLHEADRVGTRLTLSEAIELRDALNRAIEEVEQFEYTRLREATKAAATDSDWAENVLNG